MKINNNNISLEEAMKFANHNELFFKRRENNMLLSDYQISILSRNGIDYKKYTSIRELMFEIENNLDEYFDEELDLVSSQLSEYIYYNDTKK